MKEVLIKLLDNSRSDYFNFRVSAAVVTKDKTYYGVNVETSSPAAGICAERNALFSAITDGVDTKDIKEVHVMSKNGVTPCFICRQAFVDYLDMSTKVYIYDLSGLKESFLVSDLITHAFGKEDLE